MRLLWAAVLVPPVFGAEAAVVFTSLYSHPSVSDGANPQAALVQGTGGSFCGMTEHRGQGGTYSDEYWGIVNQSRLIALASSRRVSAKLCRIVGELLHPASVY